MKKSLMLLIISILITSFAVTVTALPNCPTWIGAGFCFDCNSVNEMDLTMEEKQDLCEDSYTFLEGGETCVMCEWVPECCGNGYCAAPEENPTYCECPVEECTDEVDNDCDTHIDCEDNDCFDDPNCNDACEVDDDCGVCQLCLDNTCVIDPGCAGKGGDIPEFSSYGILLVVISAIAFYTYMKKKKK